MVELIRSTDVDPVAALWRGILITTELVCETPLGSHNGVLLMSGVP